MLHCLPAKAPTLAAFINAIYGKTAPRCSFRHQPELFSAARRTLNRRTQPECYYLVIQPLILELEARCNMDLNHWYADDGILIGRIEEVQKALEILREFGPNFNFALSVLKTTAYWPSTDSSALQNLRASVPIDVTHSRDPGRSGRLGRVHAQHPRSRAS